MTACECRRAERLGCSEARRPARSPTAATTGFVKGLRAPVATNSPWPQKLAAQRPHAAQPRLPCEARGLLPRGWPPQRFPGFERARRRVCCTELRATSFYQVQRAAPRGHLFSEVDPLYKKNGAHLVIHRALLPSPPPPPSSLPLDPRKVFNFNVQNAIADWRGHTE
jgi:hypothetical protein